MRHRTHGVGHCLVLVALMLPLAAGCASTGSPQKGRLAEPIVLVVMDPLAKELACACVEGYGQRDYRKLATYLQAGLGRPVAIEFSDDLADTLATIGPKREVIVVGERSLV